MPIHIVNSDHTPHFLVDLGLTMRLCRLRFQRKKPAYFICPLKKKERKKKKKPAQATRAISNKTLVIENKGDGYRGYFLSNSRK